MIGTTVKPTQQLHDLGQSLWLDNITRGLLNDGTLRRELKGVLPVDGGDAEEVLAEFTRAGVDDAALAAQLQREGTESFGKSWQDLLGRIASKSATLETVDQTGAG
jgi:hypothetical protein